MIRRFFKVLVAVSIFVLGFGLWQGRLEAAVINVPGSYSTIQAAVNAANPGDTILVDSGTYNESVNCTKAVDLVGTGSPTIQGSSPVVIFDGNGADSASISGFTITGGTGSEGYGVWCKNGADPTISSGNTIRGNSRDGIYCQSSSPTITNNVTKTQRL